VTVVGAGGSAVLGEHLVGCINVSSTNPDARLNGSALAARVGVFDRDGFDLVALQQRNGQLRRMVGADSHLDELVRIPVRDFASGED
jgi:hypothetical protein